MEKRYRISLTEGEIHTLAHIMNHFTDYMCGDDRPDHGMGILKGYREGMKKAGLWGEKPQYVRDALSAMGKLYRKSRKIRYER